MVTSLDLWCIRRRGVDFDPVEAYGIGTTFFCMKIHHGGEFKGFPGRSYVGGEVDIIDQLDGEEFNVHEMDKFLVELGYQLGRKCFYSFLKPGHDLDTGLMPLSCDQDIRSMISNVTQHKQIEVYIEHGKSVLHTFSPFKVKPIIEEVVEVEDTEQVVATTTVQSKVRRRQLQLDWYDSIDVESGDGQEEEYHVENVCDTSGDEDDNATCGDKEAGRENVEGGSSESDEGEGDSEDDDKDSDYHEEEHEVHDVEVDMRDFHLNIDADVEWAGLQQEEVEAPRQQTTQEDAIGVNLENFDSLSSSDNEDTAGKTKRRKKKVRYPEFNRATDMRNVQFFLGQEFATKVDIKAAVKQYSVETRRAIKIKKNDNIRVRVLCTGKHPGSNEDSDADAGQKSNQTAKGKAKKEKITCPWVLYLTRPKDGGTWQVKTLIDEHVCLQTRKVKACTAKYLAKELEEQVRSNPEMPVKSIRDQFQQNLEVEVSTMKAFRAKTIAQKQIIGSYQHQYTLLRDYALELQRANPGTTFKIEVESCPNPADASRIFKRCYICLGPLKLGFRAGCRRILFLDGTFMKGPYPGQLLTAVGIDPNNGIYPVAYGLVEAETFNAWKWFLECIGDDLEIYANSNFTFMTDRQKGLIPALAKVFPCAEHRFCLRHIWSNFKLQHKGKEYKDFLWSAATASTVESFNKVMEELHKSDKKAFDYLNAIGAHHWSRSHFTGIAKTDVLYNNICESFNKQLVDGRDKPVLTCLEFVREYLMQRIVNVQKVIKKTHGPLCPATQKIFDAIKKQAATCKVLWNGAQLYQVKAPFSDQCVVDLDKRTCACRKWELSAMPCKHAVAAIWVNGENGGNGNPESWVDRAYKLDTWKKIYMHKVNPINGPKSWPKSGCPAILKPPLHRTPIGRPAKKRKKEPDEGRPEPSSQTTGDAQGGKIPRTTVTLHCTKCGNAGHNLRTCKGQGGANDNTGKKKKRASVDERSHKSGQTSTRQKLPVSKNKRPLEGGGQANQASGGGQASQASGVSGPQSGLGSQQSRDPNVVWMRGLLFSTQPRLPKPTAKGQKGASSSQP